MYEKHWGLLRAPFGNDRSAESYFVSASHQTALLKIRFLIEHGRGAGLLVGPSGVGKTRLLEALLPSNQPESRPLVRIVYPLMSPIEMLRFIASELGEDTAAPGMNAMDLVLRKLIERMRFLATHGRPPVIVVDDANSITDRQVWQSLQLLLNFQQHHGVEFAMVLSGQPELAGIIKRVPQLDDRVSMSCVLTPMTPSETSAYVQHRLRVAGAAEPIFSPAALHVLHELTNGLPRRINQICDFSMLVGYAEGLRIIEAEQIEGISAEMNLPRAA